MLELEPVRRQHNQPESRAALARAESRLWGTVSAPTPLPGEANATYSGLLEYWHMVAATRTARSSLPRAVAGAQYSASARTLSQPRIYQAHATVEVQSVNENFLDLKSLKSTGQRSRLRFRLSDADIQTQVRILDEQSSLLPPGDRGQTSQNCLPPSRCSRPIAFRHQRICPAGTSPPSNTAALGRRPWAAPQ